MSIAMITVDGQNYGIESKDNIWDKKDRVIEDADNNGKIEDKEKNNQLSRGKTNELLEKIGFKSSALDHGLNLNYAVKLADNINRLESNLDSDQLPFLQELNALAYQASNNNQFLASTGNPQDGYDLIGETLNLDEEAPRIFKETLKKNDLPLYHLQLDRSPSFNKTQDAIYLLLSRLNHQLEYLAAIETFSLETHGIVEEYKAYLTQDPDVQAALSKGQEKLTKDFSFDLASISDFGRVHTRYSLQNYFETMDRLGSYLDQSDPSYIQKRDAYFQETIDAVLDLENSKTNPTQLDLGFQTLYSISPSLARENQAKIYNKAFKAGLEWCGFKNNFLRYDKVNGRGSDNRFRALDIRMGVSNDLSQLSSWAVLAGSDIDYTNRKLSGFIEDQIEVVFAEINPTRPVEDILAQVDLVQTLAARADMYNNMVSSQRALPSGLRQSEDYFGSDDKLKNNLISKWNQKLGESIKAVIESHLQIFDRNSNNPDRFRATLADIRNLNQTYIELTGDTHFNQVINEHREKMIRDTK